MNKNILKQFDDVTDELAKYFVEKYFGKDFLFDNDYYFVGSQDEDREVLAVNDYFFNLEDIVSFIRYKYTIKELFEYYDYALENKKNIINIKNWKNIKE